MRIYPQPQPATTTGFYTTCDFSQIVKTIDGGYIISANPWQPNIHNAYPVDFITIKTNSLYAPSWKKQTFIKPIVLQTGGIIGLHKSINNNVFPSSQISKFSATGNAIWTRSLSVAPSFGSNYNVQINDVVNYNNKLLCLGYVYYEDMINPGLYNGAYNFMAEFDTTGNVLSINNATPTSSSVATNYSSFDKVSRNQIGDFLVADNWAHRIHKFTSSFNTAWTIQYPLAHHSLKDFYTEANGDVFCLLGVDAFYAGDTNAVLLKLNSLGNLIFAKEINLFASYSGMEKGPNGNYIITCISGKKNSADTSKNLILMVDSNANFIWARQQMFSIGISKALYNSNKLMYSSYYNNLVLESGDINGNFPCINNPFNVNIANTAFTFTPITINLSATSITITPGLNYSNSIQNFRDTCGGFPFSIEEHSKQNIKIWPNPTTGKLIIQSDDDLMGYSIRITSVEGKLIKELKFESKNIDLTFLNQGIFFLFFLKDGYLIETKKLIISR